MWILPTQLHTSAFVPDMQELILGYKDQSEACEQSLMLKSTHSPWLTWSQRWRMDSWMQHLYGRMLKHSHTDSFTEKWTSSLPDIPVSHSPLPESKKEQTTRGISGRGSQMELLLCSQEYVSSKTSNNTSISDSKMSSEIWQKEVTRRHGEYSRRLKSAHLTRGKESLLWPTPMSRDHKGGQYSGEAMNSQNKLQRMYPLPVFLEKLPQMLQKKQHTENNMTTDSLLHPDSPRRNQNHQEHSGNLIAETQEQAVGEHMNPRWVENLMGIPVGWTMPSCARPCNPEYMNFDL